MRRFVDPTHPDQLFPTLQSNHESAGNANDVWLRRSFIPSAHFFLMRQCGYPFENHFNVYVKYAINRSLT